MFKTYFFAIFLLIALVWGAVGLIDYIGYRGVSDRLNRLAVGETETQQPTTIPDPFSDPQLNPSIDTDIEYEAELVVSDLTVPWSLIFTDRDRMLVAERSGQIRVVEDEVLQPDPVFIFEEISNQSEEGLMGLTMHPEYGKNKLLYACVAYPRGNRLVDKVVRLKDEGDQLIEQGVVLDAIPAATNHAGCRLKFGPDQKLYITTGDATVRELAQNQKSLAGKILRVNPNGSVPDDNPDPNSPIFSLGHRNPQGIDWHPLTKDLWSTEHGPSGNDGPGGGDEVNLVKAGENYGWPLVSHEKNQTGLVAPKLLFTPAVAPASGLFYSGDIFPQFKYNFFFGALKGEGLYRIVFAESDPVQIVFHEKLDLPNFGRIREVVQGLDGLIYFTTSNGDGRGKPRDGDDKIYRLIPKE